MGSLQPYLTSLLGSLPPRPIDREKLDELVSKALSDSNGKTSPENRKSHWEYLLKLEIFTLASQEGRALQDKETTYYGDLCDRLDVVLAFTEKNACEPTFPFIVLQDLLETQTISSCSHIFSWLEARASRLTEGMIPHKGKALILLRTLNDLLRRLSKMGSTTIFCGRILTFLSGVFPLGERSGVNLRGEYGHVWEGVTFVDPSTVEEADVEMKPTTPSESSKQDDKMPVDSKDEKKSVSAQATAEKKADLYNTFWSLQSPFSRPPLFANKNTLIEFKNAVNKVMPILKEANAKERAMMGSRGIGGTTATTLKRQRDPEAEETNSNNEYFFAKFLTSQELLDLEIADTHFRRQVIFQLLILLHHLLNFTKAAKAAWTSPRNRSLQIEFTLEPEDAQWVTETINKALEELRQTTPNGRVFAETVSVILEREKYWVRWKNELCVPFDKEPWSTEVDGKKVGLFEATRDVRQRMREPPSEWQWSAGTEALTVIWDMGYRDLADLQHPFQPGDVKDFHKKIQQENARMELRKKNLAKTADRVAVDQEKGTAGTSAPAPVGAATSSDKMPVPSSEERVTSTSDSGLTARPVPGSGPSHTVNPPLHPSLPPKPGTPAKSTPVPVGNTQPVSNAPGTSALTPGPAAAPAVSTSSSSTPISLSASPAVAVVPPTPIAAPPPTDPQVAKFEENKQRWAWLALRTARDHYLQHFGKIGTGDIDLLLQEIEKEKKTDEMNAGNVGSFVEEQVPGSPVVPDASSLPPEVPLKADDVKMET